MEIAGHLLLFIFAMVATYGLLTDRRGYRHWRFMAAVSIVGMLWFGVGGILTSIVGFSFGAQLYLGARLYLAWQRVHKHLH